MTKTFRMSGREYQRSPTAAPDGIISNPLVRETGTAGQFDVSSETTRGQLKDLSANFTSGTHLGRLVTFPMATAATPPSGGTSGTRLHNGWTYRVINVVSTTVLQLEGLRAELAGININYTIHAAADFASASAAFPLDTGPTGNNSDTVNRSNTGPVEWCALSFPDAADTRLRIYPFWVTNRTSGTALRISDPFDNFATFPTESNLVWFLRDRPCYTYEQFIKILHPFLLQAGWILFQHRGNNNGVGAGGNAQNNTYIVHDMIYSSSGENGDQSMFLRVAAFNRSNNGDGTDGQNVVGIDLSMYSVWDRTYASVSVPTGGGATTNQGNGINSLSSGTLSSNSAFSAQADTVNTANTPPYFSPVATGPGSGPIHSNVRWSTPKAITNPRTLNNTLNTPEGGDVSELRYYLFGDKDEVQINVEGIGTGFAHLGLGNLKTRPDANGNNFKTNFSAANGSNVLLRVGGPGTANGTNPATTVPPYVVGDRIQTVGQKVLSSPTIVPNSSFPGELIDSSQITNLPGLVQAIGTLITQSGAGISDGNTFTIDDGQGAGASSQIYEFDKNASVVGGHVAVTITNGSTTDQVRDAIRDAVNPLLTANYTWNGSTTVTSPDTSAVSVGDWIWLTSSSGNQIFKIITVTANVSVVIANPDSFSIPSGSGANTTRRSRHGIKTLNTVSARVDLTNGRLGGSGNIPIVDTNSSFAAGTEGMNGGGYAIEIATLLNSLSAGALVGEDPQAMFFFRPIINSTTFSNTGGTQGVFRLSNRSANANGTYRDHNGPVAGTGCGFDALAELAGLFGADTREINPNERSGRFSAITVSARDTVGGQIRGSMRYCKVTSPRIGAYAMKRDRNGDFYMILPFTGRFNSTSGEQTSSELVLCLGPMPRAMAYVG